MGFTSVGGVIEYVQFNKGQAEVGQVLITGKFVETKIGNYDKDNHYFTAADDGRRQCLNGVGHLNSLMENVKPGWTVQITYMGEHIMEKGKYPGKMAHQFDLAIDDDCLAITPNHPGAINPSAQTPDTPSGDLDLSKLM